MILSDKDIKQAIQDRRILFNPTIDYNTQLGACSVDLRLSRSFQVFEYSKHPYVDLKSDKPVSDYMRKIEIEDSQPFIIQPGSFVLAATVEWLELSDDIAARLEGRSSLGRLGVIVHSTAGLFSPGWAGIPVMELGNLGVMPVALYPGMRICCFTFEQVSSRVETPYSSKPGNKYAGQTGPIASRIFEDHDISIPRVESNGQSY